MRRWLLWIALVLSANVFGYEFNKMIFFGDSLSDNGNLYKSFLKIIPKSPPYYKGRFSNGPVWSEILAQSLQLDYTDYAVGGATAIFHWPQIQFISPALLEYEVYKYESESIGQDKSQILYSFWIGANDYLYGKENDDNAFTDAVIAKEMSMINLLVSDGAKYFLILNLPDLARVPEAAGNSSLQQHYHDLIVMNNKKLLDAIAALKLAHPEIKIYFIDIFSTFNEAIDHPDQYNQQYHVNITNVTESCWPGGYTLQQKLLDQSLQADFAKLDNQTHFNTQAVTSFLMQSDVWESYRVGKAYEAGVQPCNTPDQYLFWDHVHPTATVHNVLSQIVLQTLQTS